MLPLLYNVLSSAEWTVTVRVILASLTDRNPIEEAPESSHSLIRASVVHLGEMENGS